MLCVVDAMMIAAEPVKIKRVAHFAGVQSSTMAQFEACCQDCRMPGKYNEVSMAEVTTRAKLATRGLGYSWGIAEDVGRAIGWLESRDLPGLTLLARLCQRIDERRGQVPAIRSIEASFRPQTLSGTWLAHDGVLCPVLSGIALSDGGISESCSDGITARNVMYPMLLLPFAAELAQASSALIECKFGGLRMNTDGERLWITPWPKADLESLVVASDDVFISTKPNTDRPSFDAWQKRRSRVLATALNWSALDQFAQRTYAPATEESRSRGAGAGVSDND